MFTSFSIKSVTLALALTVCLASAAQSSVYTPSDENLKARQEFQDNKLGVFIHWGVYSMLADGEWVMLNKHIDRDEYAQLPAGFYPSRFNADEWVRAIKDAGARYITITSRHHDGFSMFKTAASDYNIMDATPFKRDVLKELADACQRHGIKLHFYYSHLDWHRLDYPLGRHQNELPHDPATNRSMTPTPRPLTGNSTSSTPSSIVSSLHASSATTTMRCLSRVRTSRFLSRTCLVRILQATRVRTASASCRWKLA